MVNPRGGTARRTRAPTPLLRGTSSPTRDGGGKKTSSKSRAALTIGLAVVGAGTVLLLVVLLVFCLCCKRDEGPEIGLDGTRKGFLPPGAARSPRTPSRSGSGAARSPRTPQTPSRRRADVILRVLVFLLSHPCGETALDPSRRAPD